MKTEATTIVINVEIDEASFQQAMDKLEHLRTKLEERSPGRNRNPISGERYDVGYARLGLIILSDLAKLPPCPDVAHAAAALIAAVSQADQEFLRDKS